ncbi:MAG: DUF222 domain-containing protein [Rhodococcus sp. (in: high G+C Gram-positive bacteria)]|uniref:HNH endonuclease signature motif containing protein n=1 Tax=Rhodococcus sp. TaxID=1831 RepID=UPI003BB02786
MSSTGGLAAETPTCDVVAEHGVAEHLPMLAAAVEGLLHADLTGLSGVEVIDSLRALEHSLRRVTAFSHRLIVETVERSLPGSLGYNSPNTLLIEVLRISGGDASARMTAARELGVWHTLSGHDMPPLRPETAAGQRAGEIGSGQARAIRSIMRKVPHSVPAADVAAAEAILAGLARKGTPEDVENAGHELPARLDPDGNLGDDEDRAVRRGFTMSRQDAALMSKISGELDPTTRALLDPILAKWARPGMNNPDDPESPAGDGVRVDPAVLVAAAGRDTRTAAQRNHDALTAMFRALLEAGVLGTHRGLPATAIITMTLDQLEEASGGVATTASGGLLPIKEALALAEDAYPVLAVFDHDGRPLHLGRPRRLASVDQRWALIAADRGCTRPGCGAPATMCAVHHVVAWNDQGPTDIDNLALVCDACHGQVYEGAGGWSTTTAPAGSAFAGRTEWIPPPHIDPRQIPRINHRHHPEELLDLARRKTASGQARDDDVP